jgi:poly(A) polymerase
MKTTKVKTVTYSALCIIPPESIWDPIQVIRKTHDKSFKRWMPHVNIFFPFLHPDQFDESSKKLGLALSKVKPFKITLKQFSKFDNNSYVWLNPETEVCIYRVNVNA